MKIHKVSTKQERYEVVKHFLSSGQTKTSWCKENSFSSATLYRWIKEYNSLQNEVTFVPLQPRKKDTHKHKSKDKKSTQLNDILIELGTCKIHVPEHLGLSFILQLIKEVEGLDV